jgi:hypothetical protein
MTLDQSILWRRLDAPGHDACALWSTADGFRLEGCAVFALEERPCRLAYEVRCDAAWRTAGARVEGIIGTIGLAFDIVPGERWALDGRDFVLPGCVDLDLSFTPATNLIALRRLALDVGERADAPAAWLRFPELELEKLAQRYHRVARDRYEYESPDVGYAGTLEVTDLGFVTRYPDLWELDALA